MESFFNKKQLAKYLHLTEGAIGRLVESGKIPAVRTPANVYIFKKVDIDAWLSERKSKVREILDEDETL